MLSQDFLPFINAQNMDFTFQQDNASIHTVQATKKLICDNNVNVMDWSARSRNPNPIENVWEMMKHYVHQGRRQFQNTDELIAAFNEV